MASLKSASEAASVTVPDRWPKQEPSSSNFGRGGDGDLKNSRANIDATRRWGDGGGGGDDDDDGGGNWGGRGGGGGASRIVDNIRSADTRGTGRGATFGMKQPQQPLQQRQFQQPQMQQQRSQPNDGSGGTGGARVLHKVTATEALELRLEFPNRDGIARLAHQDLLSRNGDGDGTSAPAAATVSSFHNTLAYQAHFCGALRMDIHHRLAAIHTVLDTIQTRKMRCLEAPPAPWEEARAEEASKDITAVRVHLPDLEYLRR